MCVCVGGGVHPAGSWMVNLAECCEHEGGRGIDAPHFMPSPVLNHILMFTAGSGFQATFCGSTMGKLKGTQFNCADFEHLGACSAST